MPRVSTADTFAHAWVQLHRLGMRATMRMARRELVSPARGRDETADEATV